MSAVEELTVVLEHDIDEQYQFQPGEVVRGNVRVKVVRTTAIRNVTIRVVGEGNVSWKDDDGDDDNAKAAKGRRDGGSGSGINQAEEKYVDVSQVVLDTKGSQPRNIQPGYTQFPFQYQLPENLPSSYIGKFGNVTYTMKATVTGVKAIDTSITSEPFLVLRRSPLPEAAMTALALQQEKRLWGSCSFGKIWSRISLEARGGVPGEDIFMHAEIKNHSQRTVTAMQASLIMVSTYHARKKRTSFRQVVSKKRDEFDVEHNEGRRWNYVRLSLPPYIPETRLEFCDIIEIHYLFQFRVEISGGAELKMEDAVLIGSCYPGQTGQRRQEKVAPSINQHWTVRTKGFHLDHRDDLEDGGDVDLGVAGTELHDAWELESSVPELRGDKVIISNPLFRHGSFATRPAAYDVKDVPEEQMENTRL